MIQPQQKLKDRLAACAAGLLAVFLTCSSANAAVVYTHVSDLYMYQGGFGAQVFVDLDLNGDGINDLTVYGNGGDFGVIVPTHARISGLPGGASFPHASSDLIGSSLSNGLVWNLTNSVLISCRDIGCFGLWRGGTHYVGIEFEIEDWKHYGWVEIELPFDNFGGGILKGYAYESEPGKPILAGAIPEPLSGVYLGIGAVFLWKRGRSACKPHHVRITAARGTSSPPPSSCAREASHRCSSSASGSPPPRDSAASRFPCWSNRRRASP